MEVSIASSHHRVSLSPLHHVIFKGELFMSQTIPETTRKRVGDIMTGTAVSVRPETRVSEIARLMSQHAISGLPVVDADNRVVGVVTELDMIVRNTHFKLPNFIFIFDNMIPLEMPGHYRDRLEK